MHSNSLKLSICFINQEPAAAARQLEGLEPSIAATLLNKVPLLSTANVMASMIPSAAAKIIISLPDEYCGGLFHHLELADIATILRYVEDRKRVELLSLLSLKKQTLCKLLISYPEYSVGSLVETDLLILDCQMTVADALLRVKKHNFSTMNEIFVTNSDRSLLGNVSVHNLISKPAATIIKTICNKTIESVSGNSDIHAVLASPIWAKTDAVAVVNRKNEVIGLLRHCNIRNALSRIAKVKSDPESISEEIISAYGSALSGIIDLFIPAKITQ